MESNPSQFWLAGEEGPSAPTFTREVTLEGPIYCCLCFHLLAVLSVEPTSAAWLICTHLFCGQRGCRVLEWQVTT